MPMISLAAKEYHEVEAAKRKEEKVDTVIIESIIHYLFFRIAAAQAKIEAQKQAKIEAEKQQLQLVSFPFFFNFVFSHTLSSLAPPTLPPPDVTFVTCTANIYNN